MGRRKGTPKTGGRRKGTPNKVTVTVRDWLENLIDKNRLQMERDLKSLEPKERLQVLEKFMQYSIPKMQSIETKVDFNKITDEQLNILIHNLTKDLK